MRQHTGSRALLMIGLLVGSLSLFGCPKRPEVVQAPPTPSGPPAAAVQAPAATTAETPVMRVTPPAEVAKPTPSSTSETVDLKDVFFDFDKSQLRGDQQAALAADVAWLKAHADKKIVVEGHCDERGTAEYNLSLGDRRARAVRDLLVKAGIAADRVSVVTYGEERPFVLGHDENAWKWNRRAHFALQNK
jgi:peptidoglycan-associated lipoprotein